MRKVFILKDHLSLSSQYIATLIEELNLVNELSSIEIPASEWLSTQEVIDEIYNIIYSFGRQDDQFILNVLPRLLEQLPKIPTIAATEINTTYPNSLNGQFNKDLIKHDSAWSVVKDDDSLHNFAYSLNKHSIPIDFFFNNMTSLFHFIQFSDQALDQTTLNYLKSNSIIAKNIIQCFANIEKLIIEKSITTISIVNLRKILDELGLNYSPESPSTKRNSNLFALRNWSSIQYDYHLKISSCRIYFKPINNKIRVPYIGVHLRI